MRSIFNDQLGVKFQKKVEYVLDKKNENKISIVWKYNTEIQELL